MDGPRRIQVLPTQEYFALVKAQLRETGSAYVRITGFSMRPLLRHLKDGVVLEKKERVRRGDIVLYDRQNGRYALHRVVHAGKRGFTMAGDAQWYLDRGLSYGQIVGTAKEINRGGRRISCDSFPMRVYAQCAALSAWPRAVAGKAAGSMKRVLSRAEKGERP